MVIAKLMASRKSEVKETSVFTYLEMQESAHIQSITLTQPTRMAPLDIETPPLSEPLHLLCLLLQSVLHTSSQGNKSSGEMDSAKENCQGHDKC